MQKIKLKSLQNLTPIFGTLIFILLYFFATKFYPGGSQADKNSTGFSWKDNYWCNLLNDKAINGLENTAKPLSLLALYILCFTLIYFWIYFPIQVNLKRIWQLTIQICGTIGTLIGLLLNSKTDHDLITYLASSFGLIAIIGTLIGLYKINWKILFYFGILNIIFVLVNWQIYIHKTLLSYLPVVQKITFFTFLIWICGISYKLYKIQKINQ